MELSVVHLAYMDLGVPVRHLYRILKTNMPTTWVTTLVAIVRPCSIKYEM